MRTLPSTIQRKLSRLRNLNHRRNNKNQKRHLPPTYTKPLQKQKLPRSLLPKPKLPFQSNLSSQLSQLPSLPLQPKKKPFLNQSPKLKPAVPAEEPKHEIKQSNLSIEEDIITNPHDYETQTFDFDLRCRHDHFFPAGSTLPVSKGKAYCPICGEQLRNNEGGKPRRYHAF